MLLLAIFIVYAIALSFALAVSAGLLVRSMVSRLAERLKQDGADVEGWLRLLRAYIVLGDKEQARAAADDARRALASDPDKLRRVDDLTKGLGLES